MLPTFIWAEPDSLSVPQRQFALFILVKVSVNPAILKKILSFVSPTLLKKITETVYYPGRTIFAPRNIKTVLKHEDCIVTMDLIG